MLIVPILTLMAAVMAVLRLERETRAADELTSRAAAARSHLEQIRATLLDAEAAAFSAVLTGSQQPPEAVSKAPALLDKEFAALANLGAGDSGRSGRIDELQRLVRARTAALQQVVETRRPGANGQTAGAGGETRGHIRALVDSMLADVDRQFEMADRSRQDRYGRFSLLAILCACIGPLGGWVVNRILTSRVVGRVRELAMNADRLAQGQPLASMPHGSDEIAMLGRRLAQAAVLLNEREDGLRESEHRFRELFDQAPVPYHEAGRDGIIHRVNVAECRLLGYTRAQIVGRAAWDFIAAEQQEDAKRLILGAMESGLEQPPVERDYLLPDGSRITVDIHFNLIRGERGEVSGIRAALMDVTEHKLAVLAARKVEQYAQELRKKNEQLARTAAAANAATEAKSRFLAGMSHELRTPLNSIIGFSELMYDGRVGPISDEHREFLADILTSARHLLQLINDILDLSKIESGKFEFRPEPTDIVRLAREVCDVISPLAAKKQIALRMELPAELPAVIDPSRVKQVMYNYLSNAVKFTPNGGAVTLRVGADSRERFRIEVEDTGMGIAAHDLPRLFSEFEQLAQGQQPGHQGAGLGLALTRRLVEGQGGTVDVRSRPGEGSLFIAVLPLNSPGAPAAARDQVTRDRAFLRHG